MNVSIFNCVSPDISWAQDGCISCSPGTQVAAKPAVSPWLLWDITRTLEGAISYLGRQKSLSLQCIWLHQEKIFNAYKGIYLPHPNGFTSFPALQKQPGQAYLEIMVLWPFPWPCFAALPHCPCPAGYLCCSPPAAWPRGYLWLCSITLRTEEWQLLNSL